MNLDRCLGGGEQMRFETWQRIDAGAAWIEAEQREMGCRRDLCGAALEARQWRHGCC